MNNLQANNVLPPSSADTINLVRKVEKLVGELPQVDIETQHVIHGGIYTRTICVPAGIMITGALIKIPTTLTVSGECRVLIGDGDELVISGFMVIPSSAGRKQVFIARSDTYISMSFKTDAQTVEEAEVKFTDETEMLKSKLNKNTIIVTGE